MDPRVLLSNVFRPFSVDDPFDSPENMVQYGTVHRQFTREQGIFTIHQQSAHLSLHLLAANLDAETDVLEYPSLEEFRARVEGAVKEGRPYALYGVTSSSSYLRKARKLCEIVKEVSPTTVTVLGGGGAMGIGEVCEPFSDHVCRGDGIPFLRKLLGQDPAAPVRHPPIWSVHRTNEMFGFRANSAAWSLAVALGCHRDCEFCSTSAQFGHKRVPLLRTAEEILDAMRAVDDALTAQGHRPANLQFAFFDENFLANEELARDLLARNRQELARGRAYLPLVFSDAQAVSQFEPEELLEMGIDAIWMGMESRSVTYDKNEGIDYPALVARLQSHGIKVLVSFVAGLPEQTEDSLRKDIEHALTIGASAFQFAMTVPMPGTAYYERLKREGRLDIRRPERINMSHYAVHHDGLTEPRLRELTTGFHRQDYETWGPMALRFVRLRLDGYLRHQDSGSPALRHRALGFRNDVMDSVPAVSVGRVFSPSERVRDLNEETLRRVRRDVPLVPALLDLARGRTTVSTVGRFVFFTHPLTEPFARRWLAARCLRWDPRSRDKCSSLLGLLRHGRACAREISHGMMPWGQPEGMLTRYQGPRRISGPCPVSS